MSHLNHRIFVGYELSRDDFKDFVLTVPAIASRLQKMGSEPRFESYLNAWNHWKRVPELERK